jgi:pimeloyl-ACP methyl ester carboxylesterase
MKKSYLLAGVFGMAGAAIAAKLLSRPHEVKWEEHAKEIAHADRSKFSRINGAEVHYQEAGDPAAPAVILIHGFCASTFVWSDVLLPIAGAGFRAVAPDLLGFGFSEKPRGGEYTIDAQARMIVGLMDELELESATLVGSSYGGAVAATCALDYPERVERLVMVDAVINDEPKQQPLLRLAAVPVMGELIVPLILGSATLLRWRMRKVYARGARLFDKKRMLAHRRPLRAANTHAAVLSTLRRWRADRIQREAHLIRQPALLVWGEDDLDIPLRHGEYLLQAIPDARLIVFRRCGHMPQEEYPRDFAHLVTDFCGRAVAANAGRAPALVGALKR